MKGEFTKEELEKRSIPEDPYGHIDFTAVKNGGALLGMLNDNGLAWATAFRQYTKKNFDIELDLMYLQMWFSNAIEGSDQYRKHLIKVEEANKPKD